MHHRVEESPEQKAARLAGATRRLTAEFDAVDPAVVTGMVLECDRELRGVSPGALPELVERLARQRLLDARRPDGAKAARAAKASEPAPQPGPTAIPPPVRDRARRPRVGPA